MENVKKLAWLLLAAIAFGTILSSCGQTAVPEETGPGETRTETETREEPSSGQESETKGDEPVKDPEEPFEYSQLISADNNQIRSSKFEYDRTKDVCRQTYGIRPVEGTVSTFQTATMYGGSFAVNADSVMVYGDSADRFQSWTFSKAYTVDMMIAINRAGTAYVEEDKDRYKDIQMNAEGKYLEHSKGTYYMVPTERWTEYIWDMLNRIAKSYHPSMIVMEEPEMWHASGYSEGFKAEWEKYYGEDWEDQAQSTDAAFKSMRLKVYLFERLIREIAKRMKASYPDIRLVVATHSSINYGALGIAAGMNHYLALGVLDGIIGQTWSNTSAMTFMYRGKGTVDSFVNAYVDYASYLDSVSDSSFYALADPMADGNSYTEEQCRAMYVQTVAAQLMFPEVQRFEILPWVDRAFANVSKEYKAMQAQTFQMLNDIAGKDVEIEGGTPGISYLMSDSVAWTQTGKNWCLSPSTSMYAVTMPLVYAGIPLRVKSMEQVGKPEDLKDVSVLIVSYDNQMPDDEKINQALADWVRAGGVMLCLTGHNEYWKADSQCWSEAGSPLNDLLERMGLDIQVSETRKTGDLSWTAQDSPLVPVSGLRVDSTYGSFVNTFEGDGETVLTLNGSAVAVDAEAGSGRLILCGLPSAYYSSGEGPADLLRSLTEYATLYTGYPYCESSHLLARRGQYVIAHAFRDGVQLEGRFADLYSPVLSIVEDPVLSKGESRILVDLDALDLSIPRVAATGGRPKTEFREEADRTVVTLSSATLFTVNTLFAAPDGLYPQSVKVLRGNAEVEHETVWDGDSDTLLVSYAGNTQKVEITVTWGDQPVEDTEPRDRQSRKVLTNNSGEDAEFIFRNTAETNTTVRFCDLDREVVYRFDLSGMEDPAYMFTVCQNYVCEISKDGRNWILLEDWSQNGEYIDNPSNATTLTVRPWNQDWKDEFYFRLRNAFPSRGWGGAISSIEWTWYEN